MIMRPLVLLVPIVLGGASTSLVGAEQQAPPLAASGPGCSVLLDLAAEVAEGRARLLRDEWLTPAGESAADSFLRVLACKPGHAAARAGLDAVFVSARDRMRVLALGASGEEALSFYERAYAAAQRSAIPDYRAWAEFEAAAVAAARLRIDSQGESARSTLAPLLARLVPNHPELAAAPNSP
jgi:hypothetical protein